MSTVISKITNDQVFKFMSLFF